MHGIDVTNHVPILNLFIKWNNEKVNAFLLLWIIVNLLSHVSIKGQPLTTAISKTHVNLSWSCREKKLNKSRVSKNSGKNMTPRNYDGNGVTGR